MGLLVIAIDRDNDLGRKTGIRSPVLGREPNVKAALELGLADPEESDTNTMFAAIKTYDQLLESGENVEIVTICGDVRVGTKSDMKIANILDQVIVKTKSTRAILVSDGAEDRELEPIIRSRLRIDSTKMVVVQQSRPIEDTFYTIVHKMEDPKIQRQFIFPIALVAFVYGLLTWFGFSDIASGAIWVVLGGYLLIKVAGWEEAIRNFYTELLTVTSERVSFFSYAWLIASLLMIVGITRGLDQMQEVSNQGVLAMVLAFMSIDGILLLLLASLVVIEVARTIDTYLRDGIFNINIIRFIFTVASMGLIVAGIIEIVNDLFVQDNFESYNVQYILSGIILAFLGLLVHDSIRERVNDKTLPVEE
jgi:putative membrane protein|tara:strand:+ start:61 stop:1152 length:1092 start_codon:yes stop_codon:yes gene_type:complete